MGISPAVNKAVIFLKAIRLYEWNNLILSVKISLLVNSESAFAASHMLLKCRCPESTSINLHVKNLLSACSHIKLAFKQAGVCTANTILQETLVGLVPPLTWLAEKQRVESRAHRSCVMAFSDKNSRYLTNEGKWWKKKEKLLLPVPARLCPQQSIPPLSAGVKSRKLLLYYSKSCRSFFFSPPFFLLPRVCVDEFKLFLFFMSICTFKDLLQEYLKGQEHLQSGVVSPAPLNIPRHHIQESQEK